jgi:hypothetical protein
MRRPEHRRMMIDFVVTAKPVLTQRTNKADLKAAHLRSWTDPHPHALYHQGRAGEEHLQGYFRVLDLDKEAEVAQQFEQVVAQASSFQPVYTLVRDKGGRQHRRGHGRSKKGHGRSNTNGHGSMGGFASAGSMVGFNLQGMCWWSSAAWWQILRSRILRGQLWNIPSCAKKTFQCCQQIWRT